MNAPAEKATADKKGDEARPSLNEVAPLPTQGKPAAAAARAFAEEVRRARSRRLLRRLALFVLLPTALAAGYYGLVASAQFESYSIFSVQSSEIRPTLGVEGLLASMTNGS